MKLRSYLVKPKAQAKSWNYRDLAKARQMDSVQGARGGGRLAIGELAGGWIQSDLDLFSQHTGLPKIVVTDISVDGKTNNTKNPQDESSGEVALDIQAAAAGYFFTFGQMPQSIDILWGQDMTQITAYAATRWYDVLSWSWGAPERTWGRSELQNASQAVQEAIKAGMSILCASGDNGSSDGIRGTNVDAMASLPGVIGCGGTSWNGQDEVVWSDTGGGYSEYFASQKYQVGIPGNAPGRMVPDLADVADPNTGLEIALNNQIQVFGGTSAVAPFLSGFLAALGPKLGKVYQKIWTTPVAFKDITQGSNGRYRAQSGPDPCTGLGTIIAPKLAALLRTP